MRESKQEQTEVPINVVTDDSHRYRRLIIPSRAVQSFEKPGDLVARAHRLLDRDAPAVPHVPKREVCDRYKLIPVLEYGSRFFNFNHRYLDNKRSNWLVKVMGFLTDLMVYNYDCSMS